MKGSGSIIRTVAGMSVLGIILVCLAISLGASRSSRGKTLCEKTEVSILDSAESRFISEQDVLEYIAGGYGKTEGIPVGDIDLKKIEDILDGQSAVLKSEAYCTKDGVLHVGITQRKPVMRLQKGSEGFYADSEGYIFPMKHGRSSYVVVIDGAIPLKLDKTCRGLASSEKERQWMRQMTELVKYMDSDKVWKENIVQIHVQGNGDLVLIPREGQEKFIFGKPTAVAEKFTLMECYYTSIAPARGKDKYRTVDVRYDGQIICR